ncbi:MAG TPA: hypothetical protein PLB62_16440, partial [Candidatus Sumerlaeota bacterium]|nr:hypothetical protein [Candidatus Sumerlaeota bacterium]
PPNLFDIAQVHGISDLTSATIHLGGLGFSAEDYKSPINPYRKNKPADHAESDFMAEPFPGMEMSPGFYWGSYGKTDDRKMAASWEWDWLTSVNALSLRRLTTPMPYLPRICLDVFKSSHGGYSFQTGNADNYSLFPREYGDAMRCDLSFNYLNLQGLPEPERTYRGRARLYLLVSYGPYTQISHLPPSGREYIVYDPTNGTVSPGGLILFGPSDVASKINTEHGQ